VPAVSVGAMLEIADVADQQDMTLGVFVKQRQDARTDPRVESVQGLRARRAMVDGVPEEGVGGIGVGVPHFFMVASRPGAEAHLPKAPVHPQWQAVSFLGSSIGWSILTRRVMGPVSRGFLTRMRRVARTGLLKYYRRRVA